MESQGYKIEDYILFQDNKIPMLLEKTAKHPVQKELNISRLDTSLSKIKSVKER